MAAVLLSLNCRLRWAIFPKINENEKKKKKINKKKKKRIIKYLQLLYFDICDKKKRITAVMKLETDIIVSMTMSLIGEVVILVMYFKM